MRMPCRRTRSRRRRDVASAATITSIAIAVSAATAAAASETPPPQCFTITNSAVAPEYNGYQINARLMPMPFSQAANTAGFDQYLASVNDAYAVYQGNFRSAFACTNWSGLGQRFHTSYFAALLVSLSSPPSPAACMQPTTALQLCRDTCSSALVALGAIFNDPVQCNGADTAGNRGQTLQSYYDYCNSLYVPNTSSGRCLPGLGFELASCGFPNPANLAQYCGSQDGVNDPCCATAGVAVDFMNPNSIAAVNVSGIFTAASSAAAITKSSASPPTTNTVVIAGQTITFNTTVTPTPGAASSSPGPFAALSSNPRFVAVVALIAVVVLAIIIILAFVISKRRKQQPQQHHNRRGSRFRSGFVFHTISRHGHEQPEPVKDKNDPEKEVFGDGRLRSDKLIVFNLSDTSVDRRHGIVGASRSRSVSDPAGTGPRISTKKVSPFPIQTQEYELVTHNTAAHSNMATRMRSNNYNTSHNNHAGAKARVHETYGMHREDASHGRGGSQYPHMGDGLPSGSSMTSPDSVPTSAMPLVNGMHDALHRAMTPRSGDASPRMPPTALPRPHLTTRIEAAPASADIQSAGHGGRTAYEEMDRLIVSATAVTPVTPVFPISAVSGASPFDAATHAPAGQHDATLLFPAQTNDHHHSHHHAYHPAVNKLRGKPISPHTTQDATRPAPRRALHRFNPQLQDELTIMIGDMVLVDRVFDDGWAMGRNLASDQRGVFPIACLERSAPSNGFSASMLSERRDSIQMSQTSLDLS